MRGRMSFVEKWNRRSEEVKSLLCIGLDPDVRKLPPDMQHTDDAVLAFNRWLIGLTAPFASAFKLNSSFYEALGSAGWATLKATLESIPSEIPVILDAKRGDVGPSAEAYAQAAFDELDADAITCSPYLGEDALQPFLRRKERGVFLLCHTSNPGAAAVQELEWDGLALYERIAQLAQTWNSNGNMGLVVGATYPEALQRVRRIAPTMAMLVPGVGPQGGDLSAAVRAGLTADGRGLLINVSRGVIYDPQPGLAAARWRDAINQARAAERPAAGDLATHDLDELALALHAAGCVQFGQFTLHSGETSPLYIDLRLLVSHPALLQRVAIAFARVLRGLTYDRIAAIPYAALPIGTAVALEMGQPLLYPRREVKAYGTQRSIEGQVGSGERVVVLDDVITTGKSKLEAIAPLQAAGLMIQDIVVLVDREQGGAQQLEEKGYHVHSVLRISHILETLARHGHISQEQRTNVLQWLASKKA